MEAREREQEKEIDRFLLLVLVLVPSPPLSESLERASGKCANGPMDIICKLSNQNFSVLRDYLVYHIQIFRDIFSLCNALSISSTLFMTD